MISVALMSMNSPMNSRSAMIMAMIMAGSSDKTRNPAATAWGIWLKVIHQPRIEAEAMIRKMMPVIRAVRASISTMSRTLSAR